MVRYDVACFVTCCESVYRCRHSTDVDIDVDIGIGIGIGMDIGVEFDVPWRTLQTSSYVAHWQQQIERDGEGGIRKLRDCWPSTSIKNICFGGES